MYECNARAKLNCPTKVPLRALHWSGARLKWLLRLNHTDHLPNTLPIAVAIIRYPNDAILSLLKATSLLPIHAINDVRVVTWIVLALDRSMSDRRRSWELRLQLH